MANKHNERKIAYFVKDDGYIGVTNESPVGFEDMLFVGMGPKPGGGHETVHEQAFSKADLLKLTKVTPGSVPATWLKALGYESPAVPESLFDEPLRRVRDKSWREHHNAKERDRKNGIVYIDVMFPWEAKTAKYDEYGNRVSNWWEVAAIVVGAIVFIYVYSIATR